MVISGIKFNRQPVTSGMPLRSILGPRLFKNFISDLDNAIESTPSTCATDMKLGAEGQSLCSEGPRQAGRKSYQESVKHYKGKGKRKHLPME